MLTYEQPDSAHDALTRAGIRHGDTRRVHIAVGAMPSSLGSHLAFCSAAMQPGKLVRRGRFLDRRKPITGDIEFTNADAVAAAIGGRTGIAYMHGIVHTNGHVTLTIEPDSIVVVPVPPGVNLRGACSRPLSRKVLANVLS